MTNIENGLYVVAEAKVTHADGTVEESQPAETETHSETEETE